MYDARYARPVRRRRPVWDRWSTHVVIIAVMVAVGLGGGYAAVASGPGYAPWQDRASTLLRQTGFGGALNAFENWLYSRHAPADTPPDATGLLGAFDGSPADGSISSYQYLPASSPRR